MEARVLITLAAGLAFVAVVVGVQGWLRRRRLATTRQDASDFATPGTTTVIYFYTDTCEPCRREQKPELDLLATHTSNVVIRPVDAVREQATARRFKVLTVPTTVVVAADGRVRAVNYGVTRRDRLLDQVLAA